MKLHKAIPLALAWNKQGFRHMPERWHVHVTGDPIRLSVVTVEGFLEIQTDYPGVGDFWVVPEGLKGFKAKDQLRVVAGQLCRVNGLEIPLAPFHVSMVDDLPTIDISGFSLMGEIRDFHRVWNLACDHMATDPDRYAITNVAVALVDGRLAVAATNGKILFATAVADFVKPILVPGEIARFIGRFDGDLALQTRKDKEINWIRVDTDDTLLVTRAAEGEFPNISNIFPRTPVDVQFSVEASAWKSAWTAVRVHPDSGDTIHKGIVDVHDGKVTVRPPQKGDRPTSISIPCTLRGDARRTFMLNCDLALTSIPGDGTIEVCIYDMRTKDEMYRGPVHILGGLGECLVMPMNIEEDCGDKDILARLAEKAATEERE